MAFMITKNKTDEIINQLNQNQVVCFKTDTIWGLSANPKSSTAIKNLYTIKQRNLDKPFIFLISKNQDLNCLVESLNTTEQKLISHFWPGPLTIIFKAKENLDILQNYTQKQTIALRMPKDELCQELLQKIDYPLPSTSVNIEGQPSLNSIEEIQETFKNENIYLLNKNTKKDRNISSTIIISENEKVNVLREGSISKQDILNVLKS
jgi:L-threonylcarbamoyladenylate synthase